MKDTKKKTEKQSQKAAYILNVIRLQQNALTDKTEQDWTKLDKTRQDWTRLYMFDSNSSTLKFDSNSFTGKLWWLWTSWQWSGNYLFSIYQSGIMKKIPTVQALFKILA